MKYTHLIAVAVVSGSLVFTSNVFADDASKDKKKPAAAKKVKQGRSLPGALGKLELDYDDRKEIAELLKDVSAKRREAGRNKELQAEIRRDYQAKLAEILGEAKMAELKKLNAEMAKNRKKANKGGKKGPNTDRKKKSDN